MVAEEGCDMMTENEKNMETFFICCVALLPLVVAILIDILGYVLK